MKRKIHSDQTKGKIRTIDVEYLDLDNSVLDNDIETDITLTYIPIRATKKATHRYIVTIQKT